MTSDPHRTIRHELLVRCLDTWLPTVLPGHKRVTYVDTDPASAAAAARVVCELADDLSRHSVTMVVGGTDSTDPVLARIPAGLTVVTTTGPLLSALRDAHALGTATFGWLRWPVPADLLSTVAEHRPVELVLVGGDAEAGALLARVGLAPLARVELVDGAGRAEPLWFSTNAAPPAAARALEKFKDELWALDEYAGIRLRDPHDPDGTLLDISVSPALGPLRRALAAHVAQAGGATVAQLRAWTLHETVYRAADTTKAVQALLASGLLSREPIGGRLSAATLLRPPAGPADDRSDGPAGPDDE